MESLLRWGIQNSQTEGAGETSSTPVQRKDLDPAILDQILGRPDSELMKEALEKALNENLDEDARVTALDDMEMLVEHIDNASDLEKLKMWEPLHSLLTSHSSTDDIKVQALWVIGTAVQNNPAAQKAYLSLNPLPAILFFLSPSVRSSALRSKAVYALSGLLKHNALAVDQLERTGGWDVLRDALQDSDISVRRKVAFLLNTLLIPTQDPAHAFPTGPTTGTGATLHGSDAQQSTNTTAPVHANSHASMLSNPTSTATAPATLQALHAYKIVPTLVRALAAPTPHGPDGESEGDEDMEEKVARLLHTYVSAHEGEFWEEERVALREFLKGGRAGKDEEGRTLGLDAGELESLRKAVA